MEQCLGSAPRGSRAAFARALQQPPAADEQPPAADEKEAPAPKKKVSLRSPDDGWFDLGAFLDTSYGFVPILWPITEPAIGYGGCAALAFIGKSGTDTRAGFDQPNVTGVAGIGTENGTWGAAAMDSRYWMDNQLQTLVEAFGASINLDFYGIGADSILNDHPLEYNLAPVGGVVRGKYRIHRSRTWAGLGYTWMTTGTSFDAPEETPGLPDFHRDSRVGGLTPSLTFDSRDSIFTPSSGTYLEGGGSFYGKWLGGDADFSFGRQPFYMRPYIDMRGVPAMEYQGENAAKLEAELRWKRTVTAGGTGFRYELARKYKLHMGVDVAFGPDGAAFYLQFGSAWMRP